MKNTVLLAAALCAPLAMAQEITDPSASAADTRTQKAEAAIDELCELQVKIVEQLESAKDRDSADAAAEQLFTIISRVQELQGDARAIKDCDKATQQRLLKKLLVVTFSIDKRKKAVGKSLVENEFYGSENLKNAVRMML